MSEAFYRIRHRHPSLDTLGIAVEHCPGYVNRRLNLHSVDVLLLSFIIDGHGWHHIDGSRFVESGASLAVTHFGQRHDIITGDGCMDVINVYLNPSRHVLPVFPAPLQQVLPLFLPLHPRFVHSLNRIVRIQFEDPQPMAQLLFAIERELRNRGIGWQESVDLYWHLFLMHCCRQVLVNGFVPPAEGRSRIEQLRLFLDRHFAEDHTLESLARRAGLAPTSLCRAFKAHTGKPVFDYLIERRIHAAMLSLRSSSDKVLKIALDVGFNDLSFFSRKFRRIVGMTPGAYREQFRDV